MKRKSNLDNLIKLEHATDSPATGKVKPKHTRRKSSPEFVSQGNIVKIPMTNRPGVFAIIDAEDAPKCADFFWHMNGKPGHEYPSRTPQRRLGEPAGARIRLHNFVLGYFPKKGFVVDHINGDKLDNRKSNLRICTQAQNQHNRRKNSGPQTSQYKGVHLTKRNSKPWTAQIGINGRTQYVGSFDTAEEAARAYDRRAILAFGPYAHLNFPIKRLTPESE